ncbi:extracellular solute-binding protein [Paenibacillus sp. TAB 01]|uniref:extracellular solute-binding protein n=1 Tax=Paenibacillus sp. TAB 01 TaxID=3368988 RepID=UPI0037522922
MGNKPDSRQNLRDSAERGSSIERTKIRKDWLTKLGLPMPKTVEEFREALKKIVAADLDGNGKQDTLGVIAKTDLLGTSTGGFSSAFGADKPTYNAEGGLIYNKLTPQFTDTVNYFRQLYADGSLAQEFAVMKSTQAQELFQTGKAAAYLNESMRWDYPFTQSLKKDQPDAEVETVMLQGTGRLHDQQGNRRRRYYADFEEGTGREGKANTGLHGENDDQGILRSYGLRSRRHSLQQGRRENQAD